MKDSKSKYVASLKKKQDAYPPARKPHSSVAGIEGAAKRTVDIALSSLALVALAPLMAAIALLVKVSQGGPVIYLQRRIGLRGVQFTIFKFRTMRTDAEEGIGAIWSLKNDPRCTRLGAWLRRWGLDELPQLWNILRGDMTLVGPRPERPEFVKEFSETLPAYGARHAVRCGLTGYAQVHGWRGATSIEERLRHDLYYVRHWSMRLDIRILALTLVRGWSERTRNGIP